MPTLPQTKFFPPLPHRELIPRDSLTGWLKEELPVSRLVLLSAPAGYGKTTLLASLPQVLPDYPLAWLALDKDDNDGVRFLSGLGEALDAIESRLKAVITSQLAVSTGLVSGGATVLPLQQVMAEVINVVLERSLPPFILALDDLHEINNPAIFEALDYLLDHMPPQMHLAAATRRNPPLYLHRLRARRQLAELEMSDLCFDLHESQFFLNDLLHLGLSENDVRILLQKTEGWPVGLVLLTGRLRGLPPPAERTLFLKQLERVDPSTFQYLAEEVLAQQPKELQSFLLETSIIGELEANLCQAITGRENAQELLIELYRRNLFLTLVCPPDGETPAVYRCHALFAQFLQETLKKKDLNHWRELQRRAARTVNEPGRVIAHLLAAEEWALAAGHIEAVGELFLQNGLQETVSGWIKNLPEELVAKHSRLLYLHGLTGLLKGDLEEARSSLEKALTQPDLEWETQTHGQALVGLASLAFICAEFERCVALVQQAEPYLSGLQERIVFLMLRASLALFYQSNWERAELDLRQALKLVLASDDQRLWFLFSLYLAPEFTVIPGMLELLEDFCEKAGQMYGTQVTPLRLGVLDTLASIHLRRGRLKMAIQTANDTLKVKKELGGYPFLGLNACLAGAAACRGLGDTQTAADFLQQAVRQAGEAELNQALTGNMYYPLGRLYWQQGKQAQAHQAYQAMAALQKRLPLVEVLQPMLAGLLELSAMRFEQAEANLLKAAQRQEKEWVSRIYGSARLLLACLYQARGKPKEALVELDAVLKDCTLNGCPGVILQEMPLAEALLQLAAKQGEMGEQAQALLALTGTQTETPGEGPLTGRQMEILQLMAAGYSNQAIADELVLSLATVKSHVVHIMNRLGVDSRMGAVACARQMGLLL
jgi:LuxR family transcriptional regulator, maltose regulon positive regulatory protein